MDVSGELKLLAALLKAAGHDEATAEAETLLARALGCRRLEIYLHGERQLRPDQLARLRVQAQRLQGAEPLQYVLGEVEFCGHVFACDARALVPRPETELLVEAAFGFTRVWNQPQPLVADLGTGTGCIAITFALEQPRAKIFAVDSSAGALGLARENAVRHGVAANIEFVQADLLAPFGAGGLDLIVSNPPYVPTEEWELLPRHIRDFEPRNALDAGPDGLDVLRRLVKQAAEKLAPGGALALEIGEDQGRRVANLLRAAGLVHVAVKKDFAGWDRVVTAENRT
jgi:release factor glutamine methyltransferase